LRLLRRDPRFKSFLDQRYRESGLQSHLREMPLFRFLDDTTIAKIASITRIESYGDMEWFNSYRESVGEDVQLRIEREPVIAREGKAIQDLCLIRAGFARLSHSHGNGHQTIAYLGRGRMFGLDELAQQFRNPSLGIVPYQASLRALGFVDVLKIPAEVVLQELLPKVRRSELPKPIVHLRYDTGGKVVPDPNVPRAEPLLETPLVEFLVDQRFINGQKTMLIDLDRCTGCDECVKACATTHGGTPRFIRNGPQYGPLQFVHACMHCVDPVCMIGCPTGAIARDSKSGVVSIDPATCIGCKTCAESCPYENIVMLPVRDGKGNDLIHEDTRLPILQASKCDLCQNLATGPACQSACPHQALVRINTSDNRALQAWIQKRAA
jgi:Fe-S-cluster-containing dehydrogenase component